MLNQAEYFANVEDSYVQLKRVRHDMKNHLQILLALLEQESFDDAIRYVRDIKEVWKQAGAAKQEKYPLVAEILEEKWEQARSRGVSLRMEVQEITMDINELPCFFIVLNGLIDVMLEVNELLFHSTVAECRLCEISGHELVYEVFLPCKYSSLLAPSAALENVKLAVSKLKGEFSSVQTDEGIYWKTNMAF